MSKTRYLAAVLATSVIPLAVIALADAPSDQYNTFTKDRQDIFDKHTQLRWARYQVIPVKSSDEAETKCASAGFSDGGAGWRVPTVKELLTLVDEDPHQEALADGAVVRIAIDKNAFPGTPVDRPYITALAAGGPQYVVDFSTGIASTATPIGTYWVRCVRAE